MAADSTLVNAAFKLGSARAGAENPNMKPLTDANTDISKGFMDVAQGAMNNYAKVKQVERAGLARQTQVFDSKVNKIIESIYEQEEPMHNGFVELYRGQIELLQEQFEKNNKFGKNDTVENNRERARIMGELSRIKNAAVGFRGKLGAFVEGQRVGGNKGEFNAANMDANNQALDFENYDELIEKGLIRLDYGKNGVEITSIIGDQEFVVTLDSLKKDFPLTNLEHHGKVLAGVTQTKGKATADANSVGATSTYNEQEQVISYTRLVDTPENFQNLVSSQVDDVHIQSTLKQSLETNLDVSKAILENMFVDGENKGVEFQKALDLDNDGDVDEDDLLKGGSLEGEKGEAFKQNVDALIDVITNIDNPAFNIQYSSELLGKHLAAHDKKEYTDTFAKAKAANEKNKDGDGSDKPFKFNALQGYVVMVPNADGTSQKEYVSGQLIVNAQDFINDMVEGSVLQGYDGNIYKVKDGKFLQGDNIVTQSRISKNLGIWSYGYEPKDTYELEKEKDLVYKPSPYKKGSYKVGARNFKNIDAAINHYENKLNRQKPKLDANKIIDMLATERALMERAL